MNEIFEKIERAKIQLIDLLQEDEKIFCNELYTKYLFHFDFVKKLLETTTNSYELHKKQMNGIDKAYYSISKMDNQIINYEEILAGLHQEAVNKIESHFQEKYNITFTSFAEINKPDKINSAYNLESILENMIEQVGTDLTQSGKNKIIKNLQDQFRSTVQQPEIKNNKISLPRYYSLGYGLSPSLDYNESKVNHLLLAIGLIIFDSVTINIIFESQFKEWKTELEYNKAYLLQRDLSLKFFKNRRIDITFPSMHTAEKFWQLFQLENIVEINNC